jgi:hypothetical protein
VENKKKNRYPDKLPYDHNRVLLNALINGSNSDYINASTVVCSLELLNLSLPSQRLIYKQVHEIAKEGFIEAFFRNF